MSVTLVIPAYNEEERITSTLDSILEQTDKPDEVIVVDDYSTDETNSTVKNWFSHYQTPFRFRVVKVEKHLGSKALAQNYALPLVNTKYIATIDADTILHERAIEAVKKKMDETNAVAACSWIMTMNPKTIWQKGRAVEYLFGLVWYKRVQNFFDSLIVCSGCFSIFKTSTLKFIGGFPDGTLAEDMDLTWEIHRRGLGKVLFVPEGLAYTDDPKTFKNLQNQLSRWVCAYYQNIRKHERSLLRRGRVSGLIIANSLADGMISSMYYPTLVIVALTNPIAAVTLFLSDFVIASAIALIGASQFGLVRKTIPMLPYFLLIRMANSYYHAKYMIVTGVFGRSVRTWVKGH